MSPREAFQSPVVLFYLALVLGVLLVAGLLLAVLRWGLRKNVDHAWQSYRSWLLIAPITAAAVLLGRETTIVFFTAVGLLGFKEFARATRLSSDWMLTGCVYAGIVSVGLVAMVPNDAMPVPSRYNLFMVLPVFVIASILVIPILRNRVQGQLQALTLAIFGFLYFGWMFGHVAFLANTKHAYAYLGYLLFAVEINDVAAFLAGKMFGRQALRSNISPKKTWEGSLGALTVSLALPFALWFTFPHFQLQDLLIAGLLVGAGGQVGDMALSVIKRDLQIKDMGATIPGHGGILDRIDSLIYVAPLFFHYLRYRHDLNAP